MNRTPQLFSSKAETLLYLSQYDDLHVPSSFVFSVEQWKNNQQEILTKLIDFFPKETLLAVRSSSKKEDSMATSAAGAFKSLLNIIRTKSELKTAIEEVIASYGTPEKDDEILVQEMLNNIIVSGVLTTRVIADGSPYYVINYDDESGKTDTITSGSTINKTVYIFRRTHKDAFESKRLYLFIQLAEQVEKYCNSDSLDIEFCLDRNNIIHLLQVRPLCTQKQWIKNVDAHVEQNIDFVSHFINMRTTRQPELFGSHTILGVMPDWNPAEMIGTTPRRLSSSLYRYLITSRIWSLAREQMGYRSMPPAELMLLIGGRPYIDVRLSFNSFLPAELDEISSEILVNAWLERLHNNPQFHDKIEFEIAQTVLDFCFEHNMQNRYHGLLSPNKKLNFRSALHSLTVACLNLSQSGSLQWAKTKSKELEARQTIRQSNNQTINILEKIKNLLDECCNFGTLPFSILARHAFIAESFLRSAVQREALSPERLQELKSSIQTISGKMAHDFAATCCKKIDKQTFLNRYGHLRPGSYDILSPRYADRSDLFSYTIQPITPPITKSFTFTKQETNNINTLFAEANLPVSADFLLEYTKQSISGREYSKFIFTRNISDILELLTCWGKTLELSRDDLSYLDIREILEWNTSTLLQSPKTYFQKCVKKGRIFHDLGRSIKLGYLIRSSADVYIVPQHRNAPNFIGTGDLNKPICHLKIDSPCSTQIENKIVCIENADPGFDWIFTRNIAGLITMYGGTNSHMAIRCAEYGLPAAIGVGTQTFTKIINAGRCRLNTTACIIQEG